MTITKCWPIQAKQGRCWGTCNSSFLKLGRGPPKRSCARTAADSRSWLSICGRKTCLGSNVAYTLLVEHERKGSLCQEITHVRWNFYFFIFSQINLVASFPPPKASGKNEIVWDCVQGSHHQPLIRSLQCLSKSTNWACSFCGFYFLVFFYRVDWCAKAASLANWITAR